MQGQVKPFVFQRSDTARIEHIMRGNLVEYTAQVAQYNSPISVLDALNEAIIQDITLHVLGAKRFGVNLRDREDLKVGENVFIHKSVPEDWWDAYYALSKNAYAPVIMMARHCLSPYTWTECLRMLEPVGIDRWAHELRRDARWSYLSGRRAMGRGLLVAQGAFKHALAAVARPALHGRKFRGHPIGTDRRPRRQEDWQAGVSDTQGIVGVAAGVERPPHKKNRPTARTGRGNRP